jgi:SAM-dependent methyltransferase
VEATEQYTRVDDTNLAQAQAWDGTEGDYWARHADRFDRAVAGYQPRFLEAAAVRRHDRVLDIGCGTGRTTCDAARASEDGEALGVDLSARMVEVACGRAEDEALPNARFVHGDAQVYPFAPEAYDVVISRTGAMFFGDPVAAFGNLAHATRPGGRLVLLTWQGAEENEWFRVISGALAGDADTAASAPAPTAPGPFSLAAPQRLEAVLGAAGWTPERVEPLSFPMWFGANLEDALGFLLGLFAWRLDGLAAPARRDATDRLRRALAERHGPDGVQLGSAAWLTTARRDPGR